MMSYILFPFLSLSNSHLHCRAKEKVCVMASMQFFFTFFLVKKIRVEENNEREKKLKINERNTMKEEEKFSNEFFEGNVSYFRNLCCCLQPYFYFVCV